MEAAEPMPAPNCDNPNPETAGVLPDKPLVPRPIDGVRTNLGTRNHEFLRLPDSYGQRESRQRDSLEKFMYSPQGKSSLSWRLR